MKKINYFMTAVIGVCLCFNACSDKENGPEPSRFQFLGQDYDLTSGVIWKSNRNVLISTVPYRYEYNYITEVDEETGLGGEEATNIVEGFKAGSDMTVTDNFMLSLYGTGLTFDNNTKTVSGQGACISFHLSTSDIDKIVPGKYIFGKEKRANTFMAWTSISYKPGAGNNTLLEITSGEVLIEQNTDSWYIRFDCTLANGSKLTGQYESTLYSSKVEQPAYAAYEDVTIAGLLDSVTMTLSYAPELGGMILANVETADIDNGKAFYSTTTNESYIANTPEEIRNKIDIGVVWNKNDKSFVFESPIKMSSYLWYNITLTCPCHTTYTKAPATFTDEDFAKLEDTGFSFESKDEKVVFGGTEATFSPGYVFFETGNGIQGVIRIKRFIPMGEISMPFDPSGVTYLTTPVNPVLIIDIKYPTNAVNPPIQ